jgi:valyl-tRNA synthetase
MAAGVGSPEVQEQVQTGGSIVSKLNKTYTILMPPPNLTGELHAGHAFQHYLMDTLSRIYRQKGHKTLWYPGVDHAGIQMEGVLVKLLKEQGKSRQDLSDEEFVEFAWQKANEWRNRQREQAAILGDTPDYNRQLFTLDERATKMVNYAFKQYWKDGLIYKGPYLVNWSVGLQTALSDVAGEIEYETRVDPLVTFEYRCKSLDIISH